MKTLCRTILDFEIKTNLACDVQESREMSRGILESIRPFIPLIRWDSFYKYLLYVIEVDHSQVMLSVGSAIIYHMIKFTLKFALRINLIASLLNYLLIRALAGAHRKKNNIAKRLSEQHTLCLGQSVGSPIRSSLYMPRSACIRSV